MILIADSLVLDSLNVKTQTSKKLRNYYFFQENLI